MPLLETEALVLKTYNLAEADRIVVLFTREQGVVRGVARGVKRLKSRFGSTFEPFTVIGITYFQKEDRELVSIQQVELIRSYFDHAANPEFLNTFSYTADLLLKFAPPHDPDELLYRMLKSCLEASAADPSGLNAVRLYFEFWLLRLSGFLPDWMRCQSCKRRFTSNEEAFLRSGSQLHCSRCNRSGTMPMLPAHREVYRKIQILTPAEFIRFAITRPQVIEQLSAVLGLPIAHVLGGEKSRPAIG